MKYNFISIICAAFLLVSFSHSAVAQKVFQQVKKPMPEIPLIDAKEWRAQSTLYSQTPAEDGGLKYEIRLPNDWEIITDSGMSTFKSEDTIFGEVGRYYGPPKLQGERSRISVQAIKRSYQLTAEQWYLEYLLKRGYNVQGVESVGENRVEALYVVLENQISYIVRGVALVHGKRMILTEHYLPIESWQIEKSQQASIMHDFKVEDAVDEIVEELNEYLFLDIAKLQYPSSWELRSSPIRSIDDMKVEVLKVSPHKGKGRKLALDGKIDVRLKSMFVIDTLKEEIEAVKEAALGNGLVLGEILSDEPNYKFNERFKFKNVEVYQVDNPQDNLLGYELWFSTLRSGDYYYFVYLLTVSRDDDYYVWTRNTQSFKVIAERIEPFGDTLVDR